MLFSLTGSSDSLDNVSDPLQMGSKYEEQQKNWHRILCMTISPTLEKLTESELSLNPHDRLTTACEPALVKEMSFCRIGHWGAAWAADSSALTDSLDVLVGFFTHQTGCVFVSFSGFTAFFFRLCAMRCRGRLWDYWTVGTLCSQDFCTFMIKQPLNPPRRSFTRRLLLSSPLSPGGFSLGV